MKPALERLKLVLAYDGRPFSGWQSQPGGNGIQDHLKAALRAVAGLDLTVVGSGRTDAGVHALGQVAHADVPQGRYKPEVWGRALNAHLPATIRILRCRLVPPAFHAQHAAKRKTYLYRVWLAETLHPLEIGRAWHFPWPIATAPLLDAAQRLVGTHDFAAFAANRGKPEPNTVRTLYQLRVRRAGPLLTLRFEGNGFLYRMVRLLTGSLVQVGAGRKDSNWLEQLLTAPGAAKTNYCAPPEGLYLASVVYRSKEKNIQSSMNHPHSQGG
ncbi:MAG: tRNA pseudouridine(38-40) synthase TruA [Verrucomicrobia bacterium]|nr:tRNA pseudouridine(38-40) synthase TruA [Verrucomicrobiota bacterium]